MTFNWQFFQKPADAVLLPLTKQRPKLERVPTRRQTAPLARHERRGGGFTQNGPSQGVVLCQSSASMGGGAPRRSARTGKGAAPHCAAPPRLYFGITRVSAYRWWTTGYSSWARFECSCHQSVPKYVSENVGECARPRCYRTSVARSAGPNCTFSSLFIGLASL